ncbi:hypothetical protein C8R43DRAFT_1238368 [Mycena crocata]|nr:hypothetical protein C8R43DRAFT_1238368 [Mycena crocata]
MQQAKGIRLSGIALALLTYAHPKNQHKQISVTATDNPASRVSPRSPIRAPRRSAHHRKGHHFETALFQSFSSPSLSLAPATTRLFDIPTSVGPCSAPSLRKAETSGYFVTVRAVITPPRFPTVSPPADSLDAVLASLPDV